MEHVLKKNNGIKFNLENELRAHFNKLHIHESIINSLIENMDRLPKALIRNMDESIIKTYSINN